MIICREWHDCTLTLTEDGWRCEVKHSMHRRCKGWDYCKPWIYMVTINTQHHDQPPMPLIDGYRLPEWLLKAYGKIGHPHLFGELAQNLDADGKATIALNNFGKAVYDSIEGISKFYPQISIGERVVMPNHVHFIIRIKERLPEKKPLGFVLNKWKSGVNKLFKEIVLGLPKETHMEVGSSEPKALSTRLQAGREKHGGHGSKHPDAGLVFETGFHDRILFREGQLQTMISYVRSNPQRLWDVVHNRQYFNKIADWRITMPLLSGTGTKGAGNWWEYYPGGMQSLTEEGGARGLLDKVHIGGTDVDINNAVPSTPTITMTFNAIGNRALMEVPERMQIQCSRKMTEDALNNLIEEVLEACSHGVVIVSPCISEGERRVARAVMDAGYQLIVIFPNGIPADMAEYKPYGTYFDACARGQLLILSPWDFHAGKRSLARWQCLLLNDIAAQLSIM